jgi:hypothetical protein
MATYLRLVPVVGCLYLNLDHATSAFYLPLDHQRSNSSLQHSALQSYQSSLSVSTTILHLTILEFIFWTIKIRKQLYKKIKIRYIK